MDLSLIPDAVYWKYPDASFLFSLATAGDMVFANWAHPSIPEPNREQLKAILQEYLEKGIHQPDWEYFYSHLEGTAIELAILTSPQKLMTQKLTLEFAKRGGELFSLERLRKYWDGAIVPFGLLKSSQISDLNKWAETAHLPIKFAANGAMQLID